MQVLCLYGLRKSKPRLKSELCKQQYTVTLFYFNHWAQVIVCYWTVFALFYFEFEGNFRVQTPRGVYLEGRFIGEFFALRVWGGGGLIFEGAYFPNFTVYGSNQSTYKCCAYNAQLFLKMPTTFMYASFIDWVRPNGWHYVLSRSKNYLQLCITM